jgi:hypothetical protein
VGKSPVSGSVLPTLYPRDVSRKIGLFTIPRRLIVIIECKKGSTSNVLFDTCAMLLLFSQLKYSLLDVSQLLHSAKLIDAAETRVCGVDLHPTLTRTICISTHAM